jgi:hypothetical protein
MDWTSETSERVAQRHIATDFSGRSMPSSAVLIFPANIIEASRMPSVENYSWRRQFPVVIANLQRNIQSSAFRKFLFPLRGFVAIAFRMSKQFRRPRKFRMCMEKWRGSLAACHKISP